MNSILLTYLFEDGPNNPFFLDAEVDLYCYVDHVDNNPHSKVKLFAERAVLRVEGVQVKKEFTQAQMDRMLELHLQGERAGFEADLLDMRLRHAA